MTELEEHREYGRTLEQHAAAVVDSGTEVVMHGLRSGTHQGVPPGRTLYSPYAYHVLLRQVIENAITAERDGYDAVVIGSYSEPFLREARSAVTIPVVSMAESTLLTACSLASYSVLVTMSKQIAWMITRIVDEHHLTDRVALVTSIEPSLDEIGLSAAIQQPAAFIESFEDAARTGIDEFADVIVPAEGIMNEILFAHRVKEVDGVAVMDATAVAWLHAEYMVRLCRATGIHPGRKWDYPRLPEEVMDRLTHADVAGAGRS